MKTAEEWNDEFPEEVYRSDDPRPLAFIRAIQADAIEAALHAVENWSLNRDGEDFAVTGIYKLLEALVPTEQS